MDRSNRRTWDPQSLLWLAGTETAARVSVEIKPSLRYQIHELRQHQLQPLEAQSLADSAKYIPLWQMSKCRLSPSMSLHRRILQSNCTRRMWPNHFVRSYAEHGKKNAITRCCFPSCLSTSRRCIRQRWVDAFPLIPLWQVIGPPFIQSSVNNSSTTSLGPKIPTMTQCVRTYLHTCFMRSSDMPIFYSHTALGHQLGILYRHGFVRKIDVERLATPYPVEQYAEYSVLIDALSHSSIIVNEGFAAWIELNTLQHMEADINRAVYRRRIFLIERATRLRRLAEQSKYFQTFVPLFDLPYQEGYEKLDAVQRWFGPDYGPKCALHVAVKAAAVDLGIEELGATVHFALPASVMMDALLDPQQADHARADQRLRLISPWCSLTAVNRFALLNDNLNVIKTAYIPNVHSME